MGLSCPSLHLWCTSHSWALALYIFEKFQYRQSWIEAIPNIDAQSFSTLFRRQSGKNWSLPVMMFNPLSNNCKQQHVLRSVIVCNNLYQTCVTIIVWPIASACTDWGGGASVASSSSNYNVSFSSSSSVCAGTSIVLPQLWKVSELHIRMLIRCKTFGHISALVNFEAHTMPWDAWFLQENSNGRGNHAAVIQYASGDIRPAPQWQ